MHDRRPGERAPGLSPTFWAVGSVHSAQPQSVESLGSAQQTVSGPRFPRMGRLVAQIRNEDPARLARVQDAKWRTIGVSEITKRFWQTADTVRPFRALSRHAFCVSTAQAGRPHCGVICAGRLQCFAAAGRGAPGERGVRGTA